MQSDSRRKIVNRAAALIALLTLAASLNAGQDHDTAPGIRLTYVPGSSHKLEQVTGNCDWVVWDSNLTTPSCTPSGLVLSQTVTQADVLGSDIPNNFEHDGKLIIMFGDTIGTLKYRPTWTDVFNQFVWGARDPIAWSTTQRAEDGLFLNYFLAANGDPLTVTPRYPPPDGSKLDMGVDNVPDAGISLDGQIYINAKTGTTIDASGNKDSSQAYAVLSKFDEHDLTFTAGRTISRLPGGRFVHLAFYEATQDMLGPGAPGWEPYVVMFGLGDYRNSNIYLAIIPKHDFETGVDRSGQSATRYFAGLNGDSLAWSSVESDAMPVVLDVDPAKPKIGNFSSFYSQELGLWLMMFDGGNSVATRGIYFTYAKQPWGPWSVPVNVFNDCADGFGKFLRYFYDPINGPANNCPAAIPPSSGQTFSGPSGPTIGDAMNAYSTRGESYAPSLIQRFTIIDDGKLKLFYMMATGNPYAVVLMESDFRIVPSEADKR